MGLIVLGSRGGFSDWESGALRMPLRGFWSWSSIDGTWLTSGGGVAGIRGKGVMIKLNSFRFGGSISVKYLKCRLIGYFA